MRPEDQVRIKHMVEAAGDAARFTIGRARVDLDTDRMLLFALIRCIESIGEAARQITDETRNLSADIPWNAIAVECAIALFMHTSTSMPNSYGRQ